MQTCGRLGREFVGVWLAMWAYGHTAFYVEIGSFMLAFGRSCGHMAVYVNMACDVGI